MTKANTNAFTNATNTSNSHFLVDFKTCFEVIFNSSKFLLTSSADKKCLTINAKHLKVCRN